MSRRALAVIPARGGSQRIPRKNIVPVAGRPLLAWTVAAALGSGVIDRVIVSTDDAEIAAVAREAGADVPELRDGLADHVTGVDAVTAQLVRRLAAAGETYDDVVQLLPTCPLRDAGHVRAAVERFRAGASRAQASCYRFGWENPWWALQLDEDGSGGHFAFPQALDERSQDLPVLYGLTGAVWVAESGVWVERDGFPLDSCSWFELPWRAAIDIDEPEDLELAAVLLAVRESA